MNSSRLARFGVPPGIRDAAGRRRCAAAASRALRRRRRAQRRRRRRHRRRRRARGARPRRAPLVLAPVLFSARGALRLTVACSVRSRASRSSPCGTGDAATAAGGGESGAASGAAAGSSIARRIRAYSRRCSPHSAATRASRTAVMRAVIARPARWIVMAADVACIRGKLALSGERAVRGRPGVIIRKSESLSIVGEAVDGGHRRSR